MSSARKSLIRAHLRLALRGAEEDPTLRARDADRQHVFVALAADYGNVGDLAITDAQVRFLEQAFPDAVVEPIPISRSLPAIKRLRKVIGADDIITLIGGGNTGDLYDDIQYLRELFLTSFPRTPTISLPQTIEFSETVYGRWAAWRARRAYNRHRKLAVMARDSRSYERALEMFPRCKVALAPDVVLTHDASSPSDERAGVLVALRTDLERALDDDARDALVAAASEVDHVRRRDTHVGDVRLSRPEAVAILADYWQDWRSSSLVITDRLHGMIFAVITGTPCLALDSGTGKVSQFYRDWLEDHPGVSLASSADCITWDDLVGIGDRGAEATVRLTELFAERFATCRAAVDSP